MKIMTLPYFSFFEHISSLIREILALVFIFIRNVFFSFNTCSKNDGFPRLHLLGVLISSWRECGCNVAYNLNYLDLYTDANG